MKRDIEQEFRKFHKANPAVFSILVSRTRVLIAKGHKRVAIGMLFETMRWDHMLKTTGEPFKLNNNYRAFYSRLIEQTYPELVGVFTKRGSVADE